jgi:hypothetical protein
MGTSVNIREAKKKEAEQAEPGGRQYLGLEVQPGGNQKDDQVRNYGEDNLGDGDAHEFELVAGGEAPTVALNGEVPERRYGEAGEPAADTEDDARDDTNDEHELAEKAYAPPGEDAEVLEKQGDLDECAGQGVGRGADVNDLRDG